MDEKVKIAFGINDFLVGGAQRQLTRQFLYYDKERFDITLITLFQFPEKQELYHLVPSHVRVIKMDFKGFHDVGSWLKLFWALRSLRPDIVVSSLFFGNTVFRMLKPLIGYKSIAREHNTYTDKTTVQIFVDRILAKLSYKIVAVSREVARFTSRQEHLPLHRFVAISNGIDTKETREKYERVRSSTADDLRSKLGLEGKKIALNIARLTAQKNHILLCDGFALFHQQHPEFSLVILGSGAMKEKIESHIKGMGYDGFIRLVPGDLAVERYYAIADLFVGASDIEGFSNSHLEAIAYGLPLVVTNTGGTEELVQEGSSGWIIKSSDSRSVSDALNAAAMTLPKISKKAIMETAERFDIRETVRRYEQLFLECYNSK